MIAGKIYLKLTENLPMSVLSFRWKARVPFCEADLVQYLVQERVQGCQLISSGNWS